MANLQDQEHHVDSSIEDEVQLYVTANKISWRSRSAPWGQTPEDRKKHKYSPQMLVVKVWGERRKVANSSGASVRFTLL